MEIVLTALVAAAVAVGVVLLVQRPRALATLTSSAAPERTELPEPAVAASQRGDVEDELAARRSELARLEERLRARRPPWT